MISQWPVARYMARPVVSVEIDADLADAERLLREREISSVAVVGRRGEPIGVISRTDLLAVARARVRSTGGPALLELPAMNVGDLMSRDLLTIAPDQSVAEGARRMVERHVHRLYVRDGERLVGVLSTKDVIAAVRDAHLPSPLSAYMSSPVISVDVREPIARVVEQLTGARLLGVVVTELEAPVGVFTQLEALEAHDLPADTPVEEAMSYAMLCLPTELPLFRAAGFAFEARARRVLATEQRQVRGILTGLDFARAAGES
jgi:CBS domain-containing protein